MSKLMNLYSNLKKQNNNILYLFKVGLFYNFLNDDALKISNSLNLKLTNLSPELIKCGFPCNSIEKYLTLFSNLPYEIKIIDLSNSDNIFSISDFKLNSSTNALLKKISDINIDNISVSEAYSLLEIFKNDAMKLLE